MSASPAPALEDVAPTHGALHNRPVDRGGTVVPLFAGAPGRVRRTAPRAGAAHDSLIPRPALLERLDAAGAVTVVWAPAGSGKTCLLRSWIHAAGLEARAAWVTVRPDERDHREFWRCVADALTGIAGGDEPTARDAPAELRGDVMVEQLLARLERLDEAAVLVIDDLHELRSGEAHAQLERFLIRVPARLRVVLLTRAAVGLGLHRLRLSGALGELDIADLRFSRQETQELLEADGIALSDAGVAALHERSEGWAGGLRLAAAQLRAHPDPERFAREFSGRERTVAGYLRAEILERQPPEVRDLLLRTSVLERVNGPLADALAGAAGSVRVLHELDDSGAFVTALDAGRSWFRFHPMLADLLRLELRRLNPTLVATLHRVAGAWHEQHGDMAEAMRHAQAAGDWPHAARLLADATLDLMLRGRMATVRELLAAFPAAAATTEADLALAFATACALDGLEEEGAAHLDLAEKLAPTLAEDRCLRFDLGLAEARLSLARVRLDADGASEAYRVVDAVLSAQPPSDATRSNVHRAAALLNLGIAEGSSPRAEDGRRHLEQALARARRLGRPRLEMSCLAHLALAAAQSELPVSEARRSAEQAIAIAEAHGWAAEREAAVAFAVAGMTLVWLGRFAEAERSLDRAQPALASGRAPALEVLVDDVRAQLLLGQRRVDETVRAFRAAGEPQAMVAGEQPQRRDLRGRVLRAQVQSGDAAAVRAALAGLPPAERDQPEIRLAAAALELSEGRPTHALDELAAVVEHAAPAVHPGLAAIEALLLAAAAHDELGDARAVGASLERALGLAEPDGIVLPFALIPVRELLEHHRRGRTTHPALIATILDMLAGGSVQPEAEPLLEPLSDAELRVVRHLPSNLKATEIASALFVSANTIRTHLRHIYAKLDVHTRSEAVTRARSLGLLAPAGLAG